MGRTKGTPKTGGRKKGTKNKKTLEKELLTNYLISQVVKSKGKWVPALVKKMEEGDVRAIKEGLDRVLGRAIESIDITSGGEKIYKWGEFGKSKPKKDDDKKV